MRDIDSLTVQAARDLGDHLAVALEQSRRLIVPDSPLPQQL